MTTRMNRPRRNTRRKQKRQKQLRRLSRVEALEHRVVLDGSGGLGVIIADSSPTISLTNDTGGATSHSVGYDTARIRSESGGSNFQLADGAVTQVSADQRGANLVLNLVPTFLDTDIVVLNSTIEFDLVRDEISSGRETSSDIGNGFPNGGDSGTKSEVVFSDRYESPVRRDQGNYFLQIAGSEKDANTLDSDGLPDPSSNLGVSDFDERHHPPRLVIELPTPEIGFLPTGGAYSTDPLALIAVTNLHEPDVEKPNAIAKASSLVEESESQPVPGEDVAESDARRAAVPALSHDLYFAANSASSARQPAPWTTEAAVGSSRTQVPEFRVNVGAMTRSVSVLSRAAVARSTAPLRVAASAMDVAVLALMSRIEASSQTQMVGDTIPTSETSRPINSAGLNELAEATLPHHHATESRDYREAGSSSLDRVFAKYRPISLLVGISLVSAHLIADKRRQDDAKRERNRPTT